MLIEFSVGNFRSFRDIVTFSMVAAALKSRDPEVDANNLFTLEGQPALLTSAAIYGANASGKSNFVKAVSFMRRFVLDSPQETLALGAIAVDSFALSTETEGKPSHFEMVFVAGGTRYRYGFEVTTERVTAEWLFYVPKKIESRLFEREGDDFYLSRVFKEGKDIEERTRPNALFLSAVAQWNGKIAQTLVNWFRKLTVVAGMQDTGIKFYTMEKFVKGEDREQMIDLVRSLDLDIDTLRVEQKGRRELYPLAVKEETQDSYRLLTEDQDSPRMRVYTTHQKFDAEGGRVDSVIFELDEQESDGTQKLFALSGPLITALRNGQVLIIDELDARLHPLMTAELVWLFNSRDENPYHAQLIFTTHDTKLLGNNAFRRDQIWFVEKDRKGGTNLYSLAEFKAETATGSSATVRNDASFEKDYMKGRYGAIPMVGHPRRIVVEN